MNVKKSQICPSMPNADDKRAAVFALLAKLGISYRLQEHEAVFTVAESSKVLKEKVPVKSLLVRAEKGDSIWMVIMRGDERIDMKMLAGELGVKRLVFVRPDDVEMYVGVKPGSVSLFGLLHDDAHHLEVIVDETLMDEDEIGFHPNDNTATVFIAPAEIKRVLNATGHQSRIMSVY